MDRLRDLFEGYKDWLEILLPLGIFLGLFLFRYAALFFKARQLREVAPLINGEVVLRPFFPPRIRGTYMGVPYQMSFLAESRTAPGRLQVRLDYPCPFDMEVRARGRMQGIADLLAARKGYETGEEEFDSHVLVRIDKGKENAEVFLNNPANREAILAALQDGFTSVRTSSDGITLTRNGNFLTGPFTPDQALHNLSMAGRFTHRF
ncbi:MAG: hypothetical protein AB1640_11545 [bacterium]